ncbi:WD repeat-containing protein 13 [Sparganum proliferum]
MEIAYSPDFSAAFEPVSRSTLRQAVGPLAIPSTLNGKIVLQHIPENSPLPMPDCSSKPANINHVWQLIVAVDAAYLYNKATSTCLTPAQRQLYLRRRSQLARCKCPNANSAVADTTVDVADPTLRSEYLSLRKTLLALKYGSPLPLQPQSSAPGPPDNPPAFNVLLDKCQRDDPRFRVRRLDSSTSSVSSLSQRRVAHMRKSDAVDSLSDGYAFSGIETIFDHHKDSITRIRFPHNDSSRLAVASADGTVSICHIVPISQGDGQTEEQNEQGDTTSSTISSPPPITWFRLPNSKTVGAVMDISWSTINDFLISASLDGSLCLWDIQKSTLARHFSAKDLNAGSLLACGFHPANNNYLAVSGTKGVVQVVNLSTGRAVKDGRDQLHLPQSRYAINLPCLTREDLSHHLGQGCVTCLAFDMAPLTCLWAGTDHGLIQSYLCDSDTGRLTRARRLQLNLSQIPEAAPAPITQPIALSHRAGPQSQKGKSRKSWFGGGGKTIAGGYMPSVTSLVARSWISHSDSATYLLVNAAGLGLLVFRVVSPDGQLSLFRQFDLPHTPLGVRPPTNGYGLHLLHSCFAPLISFRAGACAVSAGEEGDVYVFEVLSAATSGQDARQHGLTGRCLTYFQGHTGSVVDVALSWDESVLASADEQGNVILWRRQPRGASE